jgi:hypothetical protein
MDNQEFAGKLYILSQLSINDKKELGNMSYSINENTTIDDENFLRQANLDKDWPDGRAIFVNNDKDNAITIKVNYIDHMEITVA